MKSAVSNIQRTERSEGWMWLVAWLGVLSAPAAAAQSCPTVPGDVNGSGTTTVADALCAVLGVQAEQLGGPTPGCVGPFPHSTDVDCDGQTLVADVIMAVHISLGKELSGEIDGDGDGCPDACQGPCQEGSMAFFYTGEVQQFQVPVGCSALDIKLWGGGGGTAWQSGGAGGFTRASLTLTGGEILDVYVGAHGGSVAYVNNFWRVGGAGGGRSEVRRSDGVTLVGA